MWIVLAGAAAFARRGLAFAYHRLLADDPLDTVTEAQPALGRRPAGEFEKRSQARFWLPSYDIGDPMCTSYIAALVEFDEVRTTLCLVLQGARISKQLVGRNASTTDIDLWTCPSCVILRRNTFPTGRRRSTSRGLDHTVLTMQAEQRHGA